MIEHIILQASIALLVGVYRLFFIQCLSAMGLLKMKNEEREFPETVAVLNKPLGTCDDCQRENREMVQPQVWVK